MTAGDRSSRPARRSLVLHATFRRPWVRLRPMQSTRRHTRVPRRTREAYGPGMQFEVLGPLEVAGQDGPIALGGPKQRAVLANLIVRPTSSSPSDALIDLVWRDEPPESARKVLQTYVSHLRKALGPGRLEGRAPGYILHVDRRKLDVRRFEDLLRDAGHSTARPIGRRHCSARPSTCGGDPPSPICRPRGPSRARSHGWRTFG